LAIVSRTIQEFGGALAIASVEGEGTVVTVTFPAAELSPVPQVSADPVVKT
jgi:signal transduction histidine kinase